MHLKGVKGSRANRCAALLFQWLLTTHAGPDRSLLCKSHLGMAKPMVLFWPMQGKPRCSASKVH